LTGEFHITPSPPHSAERDVPLRDKMLKQPDGNDRFSQKPDGFVSIIGEVYVQTTVKFIPMYRHGMAH